MKENKDKGENLIITFRQFLFIGRELRVGVAVAEAAVQTGHGFKHVPAISVCLLRWAELQLELDMNLNMSLPFMLGPWG